jgi:hypothetical protein
MQLNGVDYTLRIFCWSWLKGKRHAVMLPAPVREVTLLVKCRDDGNQEGSRRKRQSSEEIKRLVTDFGAGDCDRTSFAAIMVWR